jgi:hypothetical protein
MGRNARLRGMRREFKSIAAHAPSPTIEESIHRWRQIGSPNSRIYFELSNPTLAELRRTAHQLAAAMPDRAFRYGFDEDNDPFIDVKCNVPT